MTIITREVYELRCDCCHRVATDLLVSTAISRPALIEAARARGWTLRATEHRCPTCSQPRHDARKHELP